MNTAQLPAIHPALWPASQLASHQSITVPTGYPQLDAELPNQGWPEGTLIELLPQQPGIGEMRLLQPALAAIAARPIALVQPPYCPDVVAWSHWRLPPDQLLWIRPGRSADALWSAEQILRNGSCAALLLWESNARPEQLRRLHLAAETTDMLFWIMRPLAAEQDSSPAPLRIALRPAIGGLQIDIVKRRGPKHEAPLILPLDFTATSAIREPHHAFVDQRASAPIAAGNLSPELV